jgi:hypothetical protein
MCDKCFLSDINSFQSEKDYLDFDLVLTKKLVNEKVVKYINFVKIAEVKIDSRDYNDIGYHTYMCSVCGQLWALRDPDYSDKGFFRKITKEKIDIDSKLFSKEKKTGCSTLLMAMIMILTMFFLYKLPIY